MNDDDNINENPWINGKPILTKWEEQCIEEIVKTQDFVDEQIENEKATIAERLSCLFQNAATAVTQLHKDKNVTTLWIPFQHAATNVTALYRACIESSPVLSELSVQKGIQKRNSEIMEWAKGRNKRTIRRDELLAYLSGRPFPNQPRSTPRLRLEATRNLPRFQITPSSPDTNLEIFREAIRMPTMMRNPGSPNNHRSSYRGRHSSQSSSGGFLDEDSRKRPATNDYDVTMESPTHKRNRYT